MIEITTQSGKTYFYDTGKTTEIGVKHIIEPIIALSGNHTLEVFSEQELTNKVFLSVTKIESYKIV